MKYFQTLPEQEYVFKNYFELGAKEGVCCADCGTYITRVVQLYGTADGLTYNVGTTCCNKISKDRSVFLTPKSVQRKKLFMSAYTKCKQIRDDVESYAETWGGTVLKFADVDYDYQGNLRVTLFNFCKNGFLVYNSFENAQRCFSGLKELLSGYEFTFDVGDFFEGVWNNKAYFSIKEMVEKNFRANNPEWNDRDSAWFCYLKKTEYFNKWVHFADTKYYKMPASEYGWDKFKTHPHEM